MKKITTDSMEQRRNVRTDLRVLRSKRPFHVIVFVLLTSLRQIRCQEIEISMDFYALTYICNETDFNHFQEIVADKTALKVTFQWCFDACLSVKDELFIKAIHLETLWLLYRQDYEDVCSARRIALQNKTFTGLSSLKELHLEGFEKTVVDFGVFEPLRNLHTLRLERFGSERLNYWNLAKAMTAFSGTPLENIELNGIIGSLSGVYFLNIEDLFQIKNVSIKKLAFDNNIVPLIQGRVSKALPDLQIASFSVQITYSPSLLFVVDVTTSLESLEELRIYSYPPEFKAEIDYSRYILRVLPDDIVAKLFQVQDLSCYWNHRAPLCPKLRKLQLNGLRFLKIGQTKAKICFQDSNVLEMLDMSDSPLPSRAPLITGLRNLKELKATNTGIRSVSPFQLQQNQQLKILNIAENNLDETLLRIELNKSNQSSLEIPSLEILNLTKCNLHWIPKDLVPNLESMKFLDLSQNQFTGANLRMDRWFNMTLLNLSTNNIEHLSPFAMNEIQRTAERNADFVIDLENNPLSCLCNATTFIDWMQRLGRQHLYGYDGYRCLHPNGSEIIVSRADRSEIETKCTVLNDVTPNSSCPCDLEILTKLSHIRSALTNYWCKNTNGRVVQMSSLDPVETNKQCFVIYKSAAFLVPLILGLTIVMALTVVILVLYRLKKQKRIEYLVPDCLNPDRIIGTLMALIYKKREGARDFQYQAFVAYSDNDHSSARKQIVNKLRDQVSITTPDDFELGAFVMDEIDRCINTSKWIVLLVSQDFINDGYCKEIVIRAVQRQHAVIPVLLENLDLQCEELLQNLLNTTNPFIWSHEFHQQSQIIQNVVDKIKSDHSTTENT